MFPLIRPTKALIHSEHLKHNLRLLRSMVPATHFFCPMIKANAYGHGDIDVSRLLTAEGIQCVGVGLIEEGIFLREANYTGQIVVYGSFQSSSFMEMVKYGLTPVVSCWESLRALQDTAVSSKLDRVISVHIKFDTGMHRLGFAVSDAQKVHDEISKLSLIQIQGVLTHFFAGHDFADPKGRSRQQLKEFAKLFPIFDHLNCYYHAFNSSALIASRQSADLQFTADENKWIQKLGARPGISLYGSSEKSIGLKPVMSFRSAVVQYHKIIKGDSISYNGTWKAPMDSVIGVVPAGYADGVHRILSNKGHVLYKGQKVPMVGNVCMDYFMIDVTKVVDPKVILDRASILNSPDEHEVTIFGYDSAGHLWSADDLASEALTISYEIFTSISERVPKILDSNQYEAVGVPA